MGKDILLGRDTETRRPVFINQKTRATHMHIIGSTGEGKSKFLEHLIRQDIINNNGLCLIDPHGYLYDDIVRWCESKRFLGRKKIILFDPSEQDWTFGFNPLRISGVKSEDFSFHVDGMVKACAKVWGGENTDKTPLLKRCLRILFHALIERNLSLLESQYLIDPQDQALREYLTKDIQDQTIKRQWDYYNALKGKQFYDEFSSTINRLMEFLSAPTIRNIIGQTEQTIDFRKIMDEGYIVLINLAAKNKISDDNARLLGSLIVNDLFMNARGRQKESRPFYLYIDECARFINEDIARILDEGRKFGLHLVLAHQHLDQLRKVGEDIYKSVMTDAKTKMIFGGLSAEDAEVLAKQIFMGEIDLEEPKKILDKPTVVGYIKTWLKNYSHTSGHATGENCGTGAGTSSMSSETFRGGEEAAGTMIGSGSVHIVSNGSSESFSEAETEGASETFIPELEDLPTQVYSMEEQIYKAMALMVNQPTQQAIVKFPKQHTQTIKIPTIEPGYARDERVERFKIESYKLVEFIKPKQEVEKQIEDRSQKLLTFCDSKQEERPEDFRY